jgi:hypothetical protein
VWKSQAILLPKCKLTKMTDKEQVVFSKSTKD